MMCSWQVDTYAQKGKAKQLRNEKRLEKADEAYGYRKYQEAIRRYKKLLEKVTSKKTKTEIYYKIADSYYNSLDYRSAKKYFKRVNKYDPQNTDAWLKHVECLKIQEKFEEGIQVCDQYVEKVGQDSLVDGMRLSIIKTQEWLQVKTRFRVSPAKQFNSKDDDYCPYIVEKDGFDHIYFTTNRKGVTGKRKLVFNGKRASDILLSKQNRQGKWGEIEKIDSLNTQFDDGSPHLAPSGAKMFYTACVESKTKPMGCQIFVIGKVGNEWIQPERLPIVGDSLSIGHPSLAPGGDRLYFSGRLTGGYGGSDIWYVEKDGGSWGKPKNCGPEVNTPADELFPFVRADSVLYFSSDRFPNMGGLDLFRAVPDGSYKFVVSNMGAPFSSAGNDFGLYYYANEEKGYFSSDRKGSKGNDIYYFEKPKLQFAIEGTVKDADTGDDIEGALVHLIGSDGTMFTDTTDVDDGFFTFNLKVNTDYVFVVHKPGYFNGKDRLSTDTLVFDHLFEYDIELESYNKTFEIPNIEFEFGSFDLTELAKHSLDSLTGVLNDNPNIVVELSAHTDMIGTDEANMALSKERAEAVKRYLISNGIHEARLETVGYGESRPIRMESDHPLYSWLRRGDELTPEFIETLKDDEQEIANQLNRRTELRVIAHDFSPSLD